MWDTILKTKLYCTVRYESIVALAVVRAMRIIALRVSGVT